MLALRTAVCSERWDEAWQDSFQEQHAQRHTKRQHLATTRFQSQISFFCAAFAPKLVQPAATLPGSSRPSAHHPWKRGLACRPKLVAKK